MSPPASDTPPAAPLPPHPTRWIAAVDRLSDLAGRAVLWLLGAMTVLGAFNAVARYGGRFVGIDFSSNAYLELQWYLFSAVWLAGGAYALRHDAHVRVELLLGRLGERGRAWVDLVGGVLFLVPFAAFMLVVSWPTVAESWRVREVSPDPGGLVRYPVKAMILLGFALLLLQAVAEVAKRVAVLRGLAVAHHAEPDPREAA